MIIRAFSQYESALLLPTAVLVAIAIPIFNTQLEKSREATDAANIRAAYAEVVADVITTNGDPGDIEKKVTLKQQKDSWQNSFDFPENLTTGTSAAQPTAGQEVTITGTESGATIDIALSKAN